MRFFSQQKYWSGLSFPPWGDLPNPGSNLWLIYLLHCRQVLLPLSHCGSPYFLTKKTKAQLSFFKSVILLSLSKVCTHNPTPSWPDHWIFLYLLSGEKNASHFILRANLTRTVWERKIKGQCHSWTLIHNTFYIKCWIINFRNIKLKFIMTKFGL